MGESRAGEISRVVCGLEVASVVSSVLLTTWGVVPLLPRQRWVMAIPLLLAVGLMVNSHLQRGEGWAQIGLTPTHFWPAVRLLVIPTLVATTLFTMIGIWNGVINRSDKLAAALVLLPLSGIVQQYLLQGFIYRRIREALTGRSLEEDTLNKARVPLAAFLAAACFAMIHAPNILLTVLTFTGGLIWSLIYERAPNILALGISHGLMSLLAVSTLPAGMIHSLSVGYKHLLYQKF
jgi:membrane protease YdiL (CAAX protease family)